MVWGGSATLSGQSTVEATRTTADDQDVELAALAADLVTPSADDVVSRLAARGISFVLLESAPAGEDDVIRARDSERPPRSTSATCSTPWGRPHAATCGG